MRFTPFYMFVLVVWPSRVRSAETTAASRRCWATDTTFGSVFSLPSLDLGVIALDQAGRVPLRMNLYRTAPWSPGCVWFG